METGTVDTRSCINRDDSEHSNLDGFCGWSVNRKCSNPTEPSAVLAHGYLTVARNDKRYLGNHYALTISRG